MDFLDAQKLLSCMTLFKEANKYLNYEDIFSRVIDVFYKGNEDKRTLEILNKINNSFIYYNNYEYPYQNNYIYDSRISREQFKDAFKDNYQIQNNININEQSNKDNFEVKKINNYESQTMTSPRIITFSANNGNEKDYIYALNNYQNINSPNSPSSTNNNDNNYKNPSNNFHNIYGDLGINGKTKINNNLEYLNNNSAKMGSFNSQNIIQLDKPNRSSSDDCNFL